MSDSNFSFNSSFIRLKNSCPLFIEVSVILPAHSCITNYHSLNVRNRYSDWLRAERPRGRSSSPGRVKNLLLSTSSRLALGPTQPPIQWVPEALSPEVKRPGRKTDHSLPTSAEIKKCGSIHPLPIRLNGVVLN
jgi:hypothetical protein